MTFSESIRTHRTFLEERTEPNFGLLDKLYSCAIIDDRERETILSKHTCWERNSQVLHYILTKDQGSGFITALGDADQKHIGNFIKANGERLHEFGEDWPLQIAEISILKSNHASLVDILEMIGLLELLYSSNVINNRQRESISSKPTWYEKNEALLEILRRRSLRDYRQTIICLHQSQQRRVAEIFEKGGVVVRVHCTLSEDVDNVTAIENEITTKIESLLSDITADGQRRILELLLNHRVIAVKPVQSIVLYIYCKTIDELRRLQESLTSGKLKDSIDLWFNSLLNRPRAQRISVKALTPSTKEFKQMQTYFNERDLKISETTSGAATAVMDDLVTGRLVSSGPAENETLKRVMATKENWEEVVRTNYTELLKNIDTDAGLFGELKKAEIFAPIAMKSYKGLRNTTDRNDRILIDLLKKDFESFNKFREALNNSGQANIVRDYLSTVKYFSRPQDTTTGGLSHSLLDPACYHGISIGVAECLKQHWNELLVEITFDNGLLAQLENRNILTTLQLTALKDTETEAQRADQMLTWLKYGTEKQFIDFCSALEANNQPHLVKECLTPKISITKISEPKISELNIPEPNPPAESGSQ